MSFPQVLQRDVRVRRPSCSGWINTRNVIFNGITVAEIADGIAKARREGSRRKAAALTGWLEALLHLYGNRVLPVDVAAARIAGALSHRARSKGRSPEFPDLTIAATHGLTLLTGNLRHFVPLNGPAHNPLESLPTD